MGGYTMVVVGTDGSESSLRAVDRAGAVAAQVNAKLIVATAHIPTSEKGRWSVPPPPDHVSAPHAAEVLGREGYRMHGDAAIYELLRDARDRAKAAGAQDIEERAIV